MMPNNPIVGGVALRRPAIQSPNFITGISGWTINADGSAEFNNLKIRGTFLGSDFELSNNGFFLYNGTPGVGNIPIAGISAGTTDDYGNVFITGNMVTGGCMFFRNAAGAFAQLALFNSQPGLVNGTGDVSEKHPAFHNTFVSGAGGTRQEVTVIQSGDFDLSGVLNSLINLISASQDGTTTQPEIKLVAGGATMIDIFGSLGVTNGSIKFGAINGQQMIWNDNTSQLNFGIAGSGPFISGESFHTLSNPAGFTGFCRVKLLPWNAIWYDLEGSTNAAGTFTFGSPPSIAYNPLTGRHWDIGGANVNSRIFVPTSGGPQVITAAANVVGCSVMVPSN